MASVQELLMAAQAKKSPLMSLLEGVGGGFGQAQNGALDRVGKLMAIEEQQLARRRQDEMDQEIRAQLGQAAEQKTQADLRRTNSAPTVTPQQKLQQKLTRDKDGWKQEFTTVETAAKTQFQAKEYLDGQGRSRIGNYDPSTGKLLQAESDPFAAGKDRGTISSDLRKEFIDRPEVKEFQTVDTSVRSMDELLKRAIGGDEKNKAALDQALITLYNKLTDPTSVVRESEYARTPENLPVINRIAGAIEKASTGGAGLTDEDRKALVVGAKIIANVRGAQFENRRKKYNRQAELHQVQAEAVTGTFDAFTPYDLGLPKAPQEAPKVAGFTIKGKR